MTGLYIDPNTGKQISTNSMLKSFRRCPKQAQFKYAMRLKPRMLGQPLKRGTWIHKLLEVYHNGDDWESEHLKLCRKFDELLDEEKEYYGDMPREILTIMRSYIWHYANDTWIIHATEVTIETEFPDGTIFRGKVDAIAENRFGLWLVDHKSHKVLPDFDNRLLDTQSALYTWAALRSKIPVQGFIWNYLRWKPASVPVLIKDGSRLSKVNSDTDYPTYVKAIKDYKKQSPNFRITKEYLDKAARLKSYQYVPNEAQLSSFFRRDVLERPTEVLKRVALENYRTSKRMHEYDFSTPGVERTVDRSCKFSCGYMDVCTTDLMGGNVQRMIKQNYTIGNPLDYYFEEKDHNSKD